MRFMHLGDAPGLGVDIDELPAAKFPYERAYLPLNRKTDGTGHGWKTPSTEKVLAVQISIRAKIKTDRQNLSGEDQMRLVRLVPLPLMALPLFFSASPPPILPL